MTINDRDQFAQRNSINFQRAIKALPIVDKDSLPEVIHGYKDMIKLNGVTGNELRRAVSRVETVLFDGNPTTTQNAVTNITRSVLLFQEMQRPKKP